MNDKYNIDDEEYVKKYCVDPPSEEELKKSGGALAFIIKRAELLADPKFKDKYPEIFNDFIENNYVVEMYKYYEQLYKESNF